MEEILQKMSNVGIKYTRDRGSMSFESKYISHAIYDSVLTVMLVEKIYIKQLIYTMFDVLFCNCRIGNKYNYRTRLYFNLRYEICLNDTFVFSDINKLFEYMEKNYPECIKYVF